MANPRTVKIKGSNLRIGDFLISVNGSSRLGTVDTVNQVYYNKTLCERVWDIYLTRGQHFGIFDSDRLVVERDYS